MRVLGWDGESQEGEGAWESVFVYHKTQIRNRGRLDSRSRQLVSDRAETCSRQVVPFRLMQGMVWAIYDICGQVKTTRGALCTE
jgi:hypothetical protein